jgi:hypothetical protein
MSVKETPLCAYCKHPTVEDGTICGEPAYTCKTVMCLRTVKCNRIYGGHRLVYPVGAVFDRHEAVIEKLKKAELDL